MMEQQPIQHYERGTMVPPPLSPEDVVDLELESMSVDPRDSESGKDPVPPSEGPDTVHAPTMPTYPVDYHPPYTEGPLNDTAVDGLKPEDLAPVPTIPPQAPLPKDLN